MGPLILPLSVVHLSASVRVYVCVCIGLCICVCVWKATEALSVKGCV